MRYARHGDLEGAVLAISCDPPLVNRELYEKLGGDMVGGDGSDSKRAMRPACAAAPHPEKGPGYPGFDTQKAMEHTEKKARHAADTFNKAIKRRETRALEIAAHLR